MKFKNKDGVVYEDIQKVHGKFRCPGPCNVDCPLNRPAYEFGTYGKHPICKEFVDSNPAEAARLMGYEIVEDTAPESLPQGCHPDPPGMKGPPCGCPVCGGQDCIEWDSETDVSRCTHCGWSNGAFASKIKEASMDKPLKDWTLGETQRECALHRRGGGYICEGCAFDFNDCPFSNDWPEEWELEKPRFTPEEVEAAQWIQRIFPVMWDEVNCDKEGKVCLICRNGWEAAVNVNVFPSLRPGQTVKLFDIGRQL